MTLIPTMTIGKGAKRSRVATPCAPLCARRAARAQWGVGTAMLVAAALCDALGRLFTSTGADGPRVRGQLGFAECLANVLH
jgi:hypothetical protein